MGQKRKRIAEIQFAGGKLFVETLAEDYGERLVTIAGREKDSSAQKLGFEKNGAVSFLQPSEIIALSKRENGDLNRILEKKREDFCNLLGSFLDCGSLVFREEEKVPLTTKQEKLYGNDSNAIQENTLWFITSDLLTPPYVRYWEISFDLSKGHLKSSLLAEIDLEQ